MLKHIVMQVSGQNTALYTQALASLKALLFKLASSLLASCILLFLSVASLWSLLVRTLLSFKALLVRSTIAELLTKVEPNPAPPISGRTGKQQATTAHPTRRRVKHHFKRGK